MSKKNILNFFLIIFIFAIDRVTKIYILGLDELISGNTIIVNKFLNLDLIWNRGIAFGIFSFEDNFFYNTITFAILLIILILVYLIYTNNGLTKYSYIVICGGAAGNLFDRIVYSSVPDFIDLNYNGFHWFIFNVADIFITLGVICLILDEILFKKYRYENNN
jgi:signal peptidase II